MSMFIVACSSKDASLFADLEKAIQKSNYQKVGALTCHPSGKQTYDLTGQIFRSVEKNFADYGFQYLHSEILDRLPSVKLHIVKGKDTEQSYALFEILCDGQPAFLVNKHNNLFWYNYPLSNKEIYWAADDIAYALNQRSENGEDVLKLLSKINITTHALAEQKALALYKNKGAEIAYKFMLDPQYKFVKRRGEAWNYITRNLPKEPVNFRLTRTPPINTKTSPISLEIEFLEPAFISIQNNKVKHFPKGIHSFNVDLIPFSNSINLSFRKFEHSPHITSRTINVNYERFQVGEHSIKDTKTGLTWARKAMSLKSSKWKKMNSASLSEHLSGEAKSAQIEGINGWRLPTEIELRSLLWDANRPTDLKAWSFNLPSKATPCTNQFQEFRKRWKRPFTEKFNISHMSWAQCIKASSGKLQWARTRYWHGAPDPRAIKSKKYHEGEWLGQYTNTNLLKGHIYYNEYNPMPVWFFVKG